MKSQFPTLDLKSTAWIAGFPVHNAEVAFRIEAGRATDSSIIDDEDDEVFSNLALLDKYYSGDTSLTMDFIGPAIDTGFA